MYKRVQHIIFALLLLLCGTSMFAQVHIGKGVSVTKGTNFIIAEQDVIINTDSIGGEGNLIISNTDSQKIIVRNKVKTKLDIQIDSDKIKTEGTYAQHFALEHLPPLTEDVIAKVKEIKKEKIKKELPVRYINYEGLTFNDNTKDNTDKPTERKTEFNSQPSNSSHGIMITQVMQMHAFVPTNDYLLPIYSTLNDSRFLDYAELYTFESLTAILKPPTV